MVEHKEHRGGHKHTVIIQAPTDVDFITGPSTLSIFPGEKTTTFTWDNTSGTLINGRSTEINHRHGSAKIGELDPRGYVTLILITPHRVAVTHHYDLGR